MELTQNGFFEELLAAAPRAESWNTFSTGLTEVFPSGWSFDTSDENPILAAPSTPFVASFSTPIEHGFQYPLGSETAYSYFDGFTLQDINSFYARNGTTPSPTQDLGGGNPSMANDDRELVFLGDEDHIPEVINGGSKLEMERATETEAFDMGFCVEKEIRAKKLEGQPSKNLMAERRRRKRLNDRLSMLRSIVPKISKMDRTSILGDTIDYVKELKQRISKLQEELEEGAHQNQITPSMIATEITTNEALVKNSPKFDVEKREFDTRISISCATRPGLLLSTVNILEALGLEIEQCVISSFSDFSVQASCSEVAEQRTTTDEDIKQALFRNAGYGGRCP